MKKLLIFILLPALHTSVIAANTGLDFTLTAGYNNASFVTEHYEYKKIINDELKNIYATETKTNTMILAAAAANYSFRNGVIISLAGTAEYSLTKQLNNFRTFAPMLSAAMTLHLTDKVSLTPSIGIVYTLFSAKTQELDDGFSDLKQDLESDIALISSEKGKALFPKHKLRMQESLKDGLKNFKEYLETIDPTPVETEQYVKMQALSCDTFEEAKNAVTEYLNILTALVEDKKDHLFAFPVGLKINYTYNENLILGFAINNKIDTLNINFAKSSEFALSGVYTINHTNSSLHSITTQISMLGGQNIHQKNTLFAGIGASIGFNF